MSPESSSQDAAWKAKERAEEARYIQQKEQEQLAALRDKLNAAATEGDKKQKDVDMDKDIEGGYGGQEDLEDRYATTSGEH